MKRSVKILISLVLLLTLALTFAGCGNGNPAESTPPETTPEATTPEAEPEGEKYNISYDLDGGIDGGNPTEYNGEEDVKITVPVKIGYDFVGWTGTGVADPTVSLTVAKGTTGDLSFKANWKENDEFKIDTEKNPDDYISKIFKDKTKAYVITDKNANAYAVEAATTLQTTFEKEKVILKRLDDENLDVITYDFAFCFGKTAVKESQTLLSSLENYLQYGVYVTENTISVIGWNERSSDMAFGIFNEIFEHVAEGGSLKDFEGAMFKGEIEEQVGEDIPLLDGFSGVTDAGEDAWHVYKNDSTIDEYNAYAAKLEAIGYKKHTDNKIGNAVFATYVNDDTVVNIQFGGGDPEARLDLVDRSLRLVVEPLANTALPMLEKPADADAKVTVCSVTMMDHAKIEDGNLCLIIQLSNGHFIVVDSNCNGTQKSILDKLRELAPDGKPVVEAWLLTHFHQDHIGGFVEFNALSSFTRYVTIKSVIYNFPAEQVILTAKHSTTDMSNVKRFYEKIKPDMQKSGTTFYQARTGQKYYFGNSEIEILWTFEDIMPHNIFKDRSNPTCIGFSITVAGQKLMITGDSSEEEFTVAFRRYGETLKSDFVQLSHHGYGDGTSPVQFYELVGAPYVLNSGMGKWYGSAEKWAADNAVKYFLRDEIGGTCTIPLPYDGGDFEYEKT